MMEPNVEVVWAAVRTVLMVTGREQTPRRPGQFDVVVDVGESGAQFPPNALDLHLAETLSVHSASRGRQFEQHLNHTHVH